MLDTANFCQLNVEILSPQIASHSRLFEIRGNFYSRYSFLTGVAREFNQIEPLIPVYFMSLLYFFAASYSDVGFMNFSSFSHLILPFLLCRATFPLPTSDTPNSTPTTYYVSLLSSRPLFDFEAKQPGGLARV